jgi:hypothetical protein
MKYKVGDHIRIYPDPFKRGAIYHDCTIVKIGREEIYGDLDFYYVDPPGKLLNDNFPTSLGRPDRLNPTFDNYIEYQFSPEFPYICHCDKGQWQLSCLDCIVKRYP